LLSTVKLLNMKISKEKLQKALEIVKPGLDTKEELDQSASFAFIDRRVMTYNDKISVSHPVDEVAFEGAVSAEELYGFLSKGSRTEVDISVDGPELHIKCGRSKVWLKMEELNTENNKGIKYIIDDQKLLASKKWKKITNSELFSKHLLFATQACSTDMTELVLTCVNVKKDGKIQSTDKFRVIQCIGDPILVNDFLIPARAVLEVVKIQPNKIAISGGWVHFKNEEGSVVSARTVDGDFFNQKRLDGVLQIQSGSKIRFPKNIDDMLQRTHQFAKRDFVFDESVEISISKGKIKMSATAAVTKSRIEDSARIEIQKDLSFWISPSLFTEVLKETRTCLMDKEGRKAKFIGVESNWEYVIFLGSNDVV